MRENSITWGEIERIKLTTIDFTRSDLFEKFKNLNGFPLRVSIFRRYPTSMSIDELPKSMASSYLMNDIWRSDGYSGVDGLMLANAAKTLNFTASIIPQVGIDFGWKAPNGSFVGKIEYKSILIEIRIL